LAQIGLVSRIYEATIAIDYGRKGFAIRGKADEGRISYEKGIAKAMSAFKEAQTSANAQTLLLAEYTFISQDFQFCDKSDKDAINSLTKAIKRFDDAFLALKTVEDPNYIISDNLFPHDKDYRINDFPKDAFHIAFDSHKTRIKNMLRYPGIDMIEKDLLKQRLANIKTAHAAYVELQKKAMGK
jgi:hypothetical protein